MFTQTESKLGWLNIMSTVFSDISRLDAETSSKISDNNGNDSFIITKAAPEQCCRAQTTMLRAKGLLADYDS